MIDIETNKDFSNCLSCGIDRLGHRAATRRGTLQTDRQRQRETDRLTDRQRQTEGQIER